MGNTTIYNIMTIGCVKTLDEPCTLASQYIVHDERYFWSRQTKGMVTWRLNGEGRESLVLVARCSADDANFLVEASRMRITWLEHRFETPVLP